MILYKDFDHGSCGALKVCRSIQEFGILVQTTCTTGFSLSGPRREESLHERHPDLHPNCLGTEQLVMVLAQDRHQLLFPALDQAVHIISVPRPGRQQV